MKAKHIVSAATRVFATITLVLACGAALATAASNPTCIHDEIQAMQLKGRTLRQARASGLLRSSSIRREPPAAAATGDGGAPRAEVWEPIRINIYTLDLEDPQKYCTRVGDVRSTFLNTKAICTASDVLTPKKQALLRDQLIPRAVQMHRDRLMVQPLSHIDIGDAMGYQDGNNYICNSFTVPEDVAMYGDNDTDFIIFAGAAPMGRGNENTVAWATTCAVDGDLRPTIGVINFSPRYIDGSETSMRTAAHEIMHSLGFSSTFFQAFGMVHIVSDIRGKKDVPVLVGKNIIQRVGNQYGCDHVVGMEVDDSGGPGTAGSHHHYRNAKDEMECGYIGAAMKYTALSIAALEDLGFYKGRYENAEFMSWGYNASCSLLYDKCFIDEQSQVPWMFCQPNETALKCTVDHMSIGGCYAGEYPEDLPAAMQYFSNPRLGGRRPPDYCPLHDPFIRGGDCYNADPVRLPGSVIRASARCVNVADVSLLTMPLCVDVRCNPTTASYEIQFAGATTWVACAEGEILDAMPTSPLFEPNSNIVCPSYERVCPAMFNSLAITVALDNGTGFESSDSGAGTTPNSSNSGDGTTPNSSNSGAGTIPSSTDSGDGTTPNSSNSGDGTTPNSSNSGDGTTPNSSNSGAGTIPSSPDSGEGPDVNSTDSGDGAHHPASVVTAFVLAIISLFAVNCW